MSQRVHRGVHLGAFALFVSVETRARSALGRGLQRAAVEDRGTGRVSALCGQAQEHPQIVRHGLEGAGADPTLGLLLDDEPGRELMGHQAPGTTRADQPAQRVENLPQRMFALRRPLLHQREVRGTERPLLIAHISRITAIFVRHPEPNARMYLQCTDNSRTKFMTGSRSFRSAQALRHFSSVW